MAWNVVLYRCETKSRFKVSLVLVGGLGLSVWGTCLSVLRSGWACILWCKSKLARPRLAPKEARFIWEDAVFIEIHLFSSHFGHPWDGMHYHFPKAFGKRNHQEAIQHIDSMKVGCKVHISSKQAIAAVQAFFLPRWFCITVICGTFCIKRQFCLLLGHKTGEDHWRTKMRGMLLISEWFCCCNIMADADKNQKMWFSPFPLLFSSFPFHPHVING